MQRLLRTHSAFWLTPLAALLASGCGGLLSGRGLNLTGGSVPVGTSKAAIIVDPGDAAGGQMPNPDLQLELMTITASRAGTADPIPPGEGSTDSGGSPITEPGPIIPVNPGGTSVGEYREFFFENLPAGHYELTIQIPDATAIAPFRWPFDLPGGTMIRMVAALWPISFNPDSVGAVQISPRNVTISPGESVKFIGAGIDEQGNTIPYSVSYMLVGDTGTISPGGTFTASRIGTSTISAWMNGKAASASISVVP